jgi:6-pyruvoyltetrahydropterin/6-carboxytetrahydropterin synthase
MNAYHIRVEKDYTGFSAAHFITFDGHRCEDLHGHNYRVAVGLGGDLDENFYVFNFVPLKRAMRALTDRLDHKMLIARDNALCHIEQDEESVTVTYTLKQKRYVFPRSDVVILPIPNTTAEMLATWISAELRQALRDHPGAHLHWIEVEVEESAGQRAVFREPWHPA